MPDFRQYFLKESINNLKNLRHEISANLTDELRHEAFRTVHTIKGGAQTFDFAGAARIASDIENILANRAHKIDRTRLSEGITHLINSLYGDPAVSTFTKEPHNVAPKHPQTEILLTKISPRIFKNFSPAEQAAALEAMRARRNILCAEIGFQPANFADEYRSLRKSLCEKGEIIASLPSEKFKNSGEIGFQIFLASRETAADLQSFLDNYPLEISSHTCDDASAASELYRMLSEVAAHGEKIAAAAGKEINFNILANETKLFAAVSKTIFDALLHLVRNAVDHAIERAGIIDIKLFDDGEMLYLSVADNGRGIDSEKIRERALEQKIIAQHDVLDEAKTLALIFAPEFSTAERLTETSGRGVGLDAVKNRIEKLNGKIFVRRRKTNGTIFEIFLPKAES